MRTGSTSIRWNASDDFLSDVTRIPVPSSGFNDFAVWWEGGGDALLPAVGRALGLVCDPIASVPWKVYRGREQLPVPAWIADPQNAQRDGRMGMLDSRSGLAWSPLPHVAFWMDALYATVLHGNAVLYAPNRDSGGFPLPPLYRIQQGLFRFVPNPADMLDGSCWCDVCDLYTALHGDRAGWPPLWEIGVGGPGGAWSAVAHLDPADVVHLRGKPPYDRHGMGVGVLERYGAAFQLGWLLDRYAADTFDTGVPAGYLKVSTAATQSQLAKLKSDWMAARRAGGNRDIAVLGQMVDFHPITIKPTDAELIRMQDLVLRAVAHGFGLSAHDLDVQGTSDTYANVQDRALQRRQDSLLSWARLTESALEMHLPAGNTVKIALDGLERGTTTQRYANHETGLRAGFLSVDEVREMEDRAPLPRRLGPPLALPASPAEDGPFEEVADAED